MKEARLYQRLAWTAAISAFVLIVLGGIVRITGSGMGCGDHWPKCNGEWFPPLDLPTMIEIGHRWAAALVSILVITLGLVAWRRHRAEPGLRNPASLAVILLALQVLLGAVTVKLELPAEVVIVHLANAMALLATILVAGLRASAVGGYDSRTLEQPPGPATVVPSYRLTVLAAVFGFIVVLLGALVANYHAGFVCQGFPLCSGSLLPPRTPFGAIHWIHRVAAFAFLGYMGWFAFRLKRIGSSLFLPASMVLMLVVAQIGIAAAMVLSLLPTGLRALHLLMGTAIWSALIILLWLSRYADRGKERAAEAQSPPDRPRIVSDLVTLTKPRIISLLLVTTVLPMFITGRGSPGFGLVFWVIIGGYLMAGGANAINMWFDRDIDDKMSRTRTRPIPSGRMSPGFVLAFGCLLGGAAFAIFYFLANPLSAWLALAGLLFYVFVYTAWLKRSSPQNIVIGGAAGAFPPLVGWTAVTGSLDLTALYLFAIIFYWTPPHFWALALIKQGEYAKAGVPMMPVVRGDRYTKIQMLGYTIMLVPLTILPWLSGGLGTLYAVIALLLGARLLWYCIRLLKETTVTATAWGMYKYSLLYLFLLFGAMGLDRAIPLPSPFQSEPVLVLKQLAPASADGQHEH